MPEPEPKTKRGAKTKDVRREKRVTPLIAMSDTTSKRAIIVWLDNPRAPEALDVMAKMVVANDNKMIEG